LPTPYDVGYYLSITGITLYLLIRFTAYSMQQVLHFQAAKLPFLLQVLSAILEVVVAIVATVLILPPFGAPFFHTCLPHSFARFADFYPWLREATIYITCASEAVFPVISFPVLFFASLAVAILCFRLPLVFCLLRGRGLRSALLSSLAAVFCSFFMLLFAPFVYFGFAAVALWVCALWEFAAWEGAAWQMRRRDFWGKWLVRYALQLYFYGCVSLYFAATVAESPYFEGWMVVGGVAALLLLPLLSPLFFLVTYPCTHPGAFTPLPPPDVHSGVPCHW
jgi:hypothetical protein